MKQQEEETERFSAEMPAVCSCEVLTMEAEDFRPYSSMMLLVSLPSISSGTDTFTAPPPHASCRLIKQEAVQQAHTLAN